MSRLPFTKSHIERLGGHLIADERPAPQDLAELQQLLAAYGDVLDEAVGRVRAATDLTPTARVKSTGTILDKLHREGGSWLKSMQDLAGMRVVRAGTRSEQDAVVDQLIRVFADEPRSPKIVDRRAHPTHGYSAVHVIAFPDEVPVEIQVRTRWQHEWAELFEKLADRAGRGIRYGHPPTPHLSESELAAASPMERDLAETEHQVDLLSVELALVISRVIAELESAETEIGAAPGLEPYKAELRGLLDTWRDGLDDGSE